MNLDGFLERHRLPQSFRATAERYYVPLAEHLEARIAGQHPDTVIVGVNGAQGTGKTTLAAFLAGYVATEHGRNAVVLSIDDLYLGRSDRNELAGSVHPLLATRGVPGTHDVALGVELLSRLAALGTDETLDVPRFDKASDDRAAVDDWSSVTGPVDAVVFEGWCVGSESEPEEALEEALNTLEAEADVDGRWRRYVNEQLAGPYRDLFAPLEALVFLQAPDFDAIRRWRSEQEHKLRAKAGADAPGIMSDDEVARFIQYFERVTRNNLASLPRRADAVLEIDRDHAVVAMRCTDREPGRP